MTNLKREAEIFGKYIIKQSINEKVKELYAQGIDKLQLNRENNVVNKVTKHPFLLPYADAGLALTDKKHILERKLLLMFSILETMPEYSNKFLARKRSPFYIIAIFFTGIKALIKSLFGIVLIKCINIK